MAKAFECWNDSGYYQIDSEFPNLRLVQKGSVYCETPIPGDIHASGYIGDVYVPGEAAVMAFRSASRFCGSQALNNDGNTYSHRFTVGKLYNEIGGFPAWVDYWAFALTPAPVNSGLQVFNQAGQLVFTSKDRPAKVLGNQLVSGNTNTPIAIQALGASYLAVVLCTATFGVDRDQFSQSLQHWQGYMAKALNANTHQTLVLDYLCWRGPYAGNEIPYGPQNFLLLDVAGQ